MVHNAGDNATAECSRSESADVVEAQAKFECRRIRRSSRVWTGWRHAEAISMYVKTFEPFSVHGTDGSDSIQKQQVHRLSQDFTQAMSKYNPSSIRRPAKTFLEKLVYAKWAQAPRKLPHVIGPRMLV